MYGHYYLIQSDTPERSVENYIRVKFAILTLQIWIISSDTLEIMLGIFIIVTF